MALYCTCGAQPPDDARFCHKCGRPMRDEPVFEQEQPAPAETAAETPSIPPPLPAPVGITAAPPITFHNRMAVRIAFLSALLVTMFGAIPMPALLLGMWNIIMFLAGGFFAVYLYGRRTGSSLTVKSGARMGWITGVFCFTIAMVMSVVGMLINPSAADLHEAVRKAFEQPGAPEGLTSLVQSDAGFAVILTLVLIFGFVFFTIFPTIGGALGAKVLEKE